VRDTVFARITESLNEYLRINAIRRMLAMVEVRRTEMGGLVFFAVLFAIFEGIGLSLLLPILQYAEGGEEAILESSGPIWSFLAKIMDTLNLPLTLPVLLALAFIPILLRQVVFYLNTWYSAVVAGRIGVRMRTQTVAAVLDADPEFFERQSTGELVGVAVTQTIAAGQAVLAVIKQVSIALLMLLYVGLLLALSVPLTLSVVFFALLVSALVKTNLNRIREYGIESAAASQSMTSKIVERFEMIRFVKLRDQKVTEAERIDGFSEVMRSASVKQARLGANIEVTADPLLMLSVFVTLYIGISVLGMTLAELGLLMFVLTRLNAKVKEFNAGRQAISTNMAGLLLVRETTSEALSSNTILRGPATFEGLQNEIVLREVKFAYPSRKEDEEGEPLAGKPVLDGISVTIPAGSLTALVGRSGAGKSTLVELLPRLRDVGGGSITLDDTDIKQFDVGSLRRGIGYLTQSAMLFNESVFENLVYGLGFEPTEEQVRSALERAFATFVYDLPDGLDTRIGDRGVRFSGGERQRIGLARVLLEDASILILDEPTSALDSESESYIQKALAAIHGTKTIIVIAHRLATVIQADQLLVIDDGRIVEQGTHDELVAKRGAYQRLFESQLMSP
jgi:ABC-type multidrug transport system fused ATPase/permease subunit